MTVEKYQEYHMKRSECADVFLGLHPDVQYRTNTATIKQLLREHFSSFSGSTEGFFESEDNGGGLSIPLKSGGSIGFDFRSDEERSRFAQAVKREDWSSIFQLQETYDRSSFQRTYPRDVAMLAMREYTKCRELAQMGLTARIESRDEQGGSDQLTIGLGFTDMLGSREVIIESLSLTPTPSTPDDAELDIVGEEQYVGQQITPKGTSIVVHRSSPEASGTFLVTFKWHENNREKRHTHPVLVPSFTEPDMDTAQNVHAAIRGIARCASEVQFAAEQRRDIMTETDARQDVKLEIRRLLSRGHGSPEQVLGKRFADLLNIYDVMGTVTNPAVQKTKAGNAALSATLASFHPDDLQDERPGCELEFKVTRDVSECVKRFGKNLHDFLRDNTDLIDPAEKIQLSAIVDEMRSIS